MGRECIIGGFNSVGLILQLTLMSTANIVTITPPQKYLLYGTLHTDVQPVLIINSGYSAKILSPVIDPKSYIVMT